MENITITSRLQDMVREFMRDVPYNRGGRYNYYVVYCGRESGVFDTWYDVCLSFMVIEW